MKTEPMSSLTDLEILTLGLFADGESVKSAAEKLELKPAQVSEKLRVIYRKLGVHGITEAVFRVERAGLFRGVV